MVKEYIPIQAKDIVGEASRQLCVRENLLLPLVEERLGKAIADLGLCVIACKASRLVYLENVHCRLILTGYEEDNITCWFEEKAAGSLAEPFDLYFFLFLRMGGRVSEYLPDDGDCGGDRRLGCLEAIGTVLISGELSGPLAGDFSWVGEYFGLILEKERLYKGLLGMAGCREEIWGICHKWQTGDPRWMEEARALLGEKGAGD